MILGVWLEHLITVVLANFRYLFSVLLTMVIMLYIRSPHSFILCNCNCGLFDQHLRTSPTSLPLLTTFLLSDSMYLGYFLDSHRREISAFSLLFLKPTDKIIYFLMEYRIFLNSSPKIQFQSRSFSSYFFSSWIT